MRTALLLVVFIANIAISQTTTIEISGSQFMKPIVEKLIEKYQQKNKNVTFSINMRGSDMGLKALTTNITDICASTKVMNPKELERFKADNYGQPPIMLPIGKNAIAILVNKNNKIKELSFEQLAGIYSGRINNWKELGMTDLPIKVFSYPNSSGVYPFFRSKILSGEEYREDLNIVPNTPEMLDSIKANLGAIGYADIFHAEKVDAINFQKHIHLLAVRSNEQYLALLPEEAHVVSNQYPIVTTMYFITRKTPEGEVKKFLDWVISPEGQAVLRKYGYYPMY